MSQASHESEEYLEARNRQRAHIRYKGLCNMVKLFQEDDPKPPPTFRHPRGEEFMVNCYIADDIDKLLPEMFLILAERGTAIQSRIKERIVMFHNMHQQFHSSELPDHLDQGPVWLFRAELAEEPEKHAEQRQELRLANMISTDFDAWIAEVDKASRCCSELNGKGMKTYLMNCGEWDKPGMTIHELALLRDHLGLPAFTMVNDHPEELMATVHDAVVSSSVWQTPAPERVEHVLRYHRAGGQMKEAEFREALRYLYQGRNEAPYNNVKDVSFLINTYNFEEVKHLIEHEIGPSLEYIIDEKRSNVLKDLVKRGDSLHGMYRHAGSSWTGRVAEAPKPEVKQELQKVLDAGWSIYTDLGKWLKETKKNLVELEMHHNELRLYLNRDFKTVFTSDREISQAATRLYAGLGDDEPEWWEMGGLKSMKYLFAVVVPTKDSKE